MRKWQVIAAALLLVVAGAATFWPGAPAEDPGAVALAQALPDFTPIEVTTAAPGEGLVLTGVVHDEQGRPLAGAEVFLAASAQATLSTVRCAHCSMPLLTCPSRNSWPLVAELLGSGKGHLQPGASATSDAQGRFRFERLTGVSFTVWARAQGLGTALHERAAPGDPVHLFLPPLRGLAGRVSDEAGRPVADAKVHVVSRRLANPLEVRTSAAGVFEAGGLGEGPFYVLVEAQGFLPHAEQQVEAGPQPVKVRLLRPRVLEVEVVQGGGPAEATVEVQGDHLERRLPTRSGMARVMELYPEEVQVTAHAAGMSAPAARVQLQEPLTRIRLELEPAGKLAVTVIDEAGQPVESPELFLGRSADSEPLFRRKAKTGELVMLGPLAPGDYALVGHARGHRSAELPVKVTAGREGQVELVLPRGTFIRGRVLDEYGRPAPRISVLVSPTGQTEWADEEGRFSVDVPSPGFYQLHAHHSDWGGGDAQVTAPAEGVELHLEPKAGLKVVVQSSGRRLEGAEVALWLEREATWRNDRPSGSDGVVLMRGMPPGSYLLVAQHPDHLPSAAKRILLAEGALEEVTVELEPGAAVEGEVVDQDGLPVEGATVTATPQTAQPATTDARGHFELRPLREGRGYRVEAHHPAYDQRERAVARAVKGAKLTLVLERRKIYRGRVLGEGGVPLRSFKVDQQLLSSKDGRFELPLPAEQGRVYAVVEARGYQAHMIDQPADRPDVGDIALSREPELLGRVRDEGGAPVEGAVVVCDVCEASVVTGPDGRFVLSVPLNLASFTVSATRGSLSGTATASSAKGSLVEVVLRRAVRVSGRVFLPEGRPGAGIELEAVHVERSEPFHAVTMQDGSYQLELPEGPYRFLLPTRSRPQGAEAVTVVHVFGEAMGLDLGPAPGTGQATVRISPRPGHALWVVRGVVGQVQNPPVELFKSAWAQMVYQPRAEAVVFQGLLPGRYTAVWGRFHAAGDPPHLQVFEVPSSQEISFAAR